MHPPLVTLSTTTSAAVAAKRASRGMFVHTFLASEQVACFSFLFLSDALTRAC